jgi:hypothetical protein
VFGFKKIWAHGRAFPQCGAVFAELFLGAHASSVLIEASSRDVFGSPVCFCGRGTRQDAGRSTLEACAPIFQREIVPLDLAGNALKDAIHVEQAIVMMSQWPSPCIIMFILRVRAMRSLVACNRDDSPLAKARPEA